MQIEDTETESLWTSSGDRAGGPPESPIGAPRTASTTHVSPQRLDVFHRIRPFVHAPDQNRDVGVGRERRAKSIAERSNTAPAWTHSDATTLDVQPLGTLGVALGPVRSCCGVGSPACCTRDAPKPKSPNAVQAETTAAAMP